MIQPEKWIRYNLLSCCFSVFDCLVKQLDDPETEKALRGLDITTELCVSTLF